MPRKINYPGYQNGGSTGGGDPVDAGRRMMQRIDDEHRYGVHADNPPGWLKRSMPKGGFPPQLNPYAVPAFNSEAELLEYLLDDVGMSEAGANDMLQKVKNEFGEFSLRRMDPNRQLTSGDPRRRLTSGSGDPALARAKPMLRSPLNRGMNLLSEIDEEIYDLEMHIELSEYVDVDSPEFNEDKADDLYQKLDRLKDKKDNIVRSLRSSDPSIRTMTLDERWPGQVVRSGGMRKGLKSLLMAGAGAALNPMSVLAEELMSPTPLGSGDIPKKDRLTDQEKMEYYDRLDDQSRDSGINLPNFRDYLSRPSSEDAMTQGYPDLRGRSRSASGGIIGYQTGGSTDPDRLPEHFLRDRFEDASGMGALRRIGGLGGQESEVGVSRIARILSKLVGAAPGASPTKMEYMPPRRPFRGRMGGWDNRLRGEEEARESAELRASRDRVRALRDSVLDERNERGGLPIAEGSDESRDFLRRLRDAMEIGRASGGIIGLEQGGPAPTMSQVTSYGVPQQTAQQWANLTDRVVTEGQRPYQQYAGQRIAGFTQPEAAAMAGRVAYGQGMGPMGTRQAAQTLGQAGQMIGGAQQGLMGLQPQYAQMAGQFGAAAPLAQQQAQQAALGMGQLAGRAELQGQLAGAGMRTTGTTGQKRQDILGAGQATTGKTAQTAIDKFGTGLATAGGQALSAQQQFAGGLPSEGGLGGMVGMGTAAQQAGETGAGTMRDIGTTMAAPEMQKKADLSQYMSQYTKGVTDPQLRALQEFQKQQGQELGSQAAQAGAFGGYRQAVQQGQQAQAATQQAADIIGKGQQEAFESAQQAFERDRAATAAGHGQRLTAEQQAAAQEQQGLQAQMGAQQQAAQMGDVGAARQLQGLQAQLGAAGQGAQLGMQGLAAQQAAEQAGVGMSQLGQQQGAQTAQAGTQLGLGALQAAQGTREQGWGTYGQMLGQQQGAIGAQGQLYGQMGGMGGQLAGVGGQQMQLGGQQQQQQLERLRGMEAAGEKQRQMQQQSLGMGYQDWQNQLNQERSNIGWQQSAMSGLPYKGAVTQSRFEPQLSGGAKALDTGLAGLAEYQAYQQGQQGAMPQSTNQQPGGIGAQGTGGQWQAPSWQTPQTGGTGPFNKTW